MKKMRLNKELCIGCRNCEILCSMSHDPEGTVNTRRARIHIVTDAKNGTDEPFVCMQCPKPKCKEACPTEAIRIDTELGCMKIDAAVCTGCLRCRDACPFHAVQVDVVTKLPLICDLCGGDPNCVKHCRTLPHMGVKALNYAEPSEWKVTKRAQIRVVGDLKM